jgi:hypothetical protein
VTNLKDKYYKYIDDYVKQHKSLLFKSYEEWLEDLCNKLKDENSLLCPIGDLDTINSLLVEKRYMVEFISKLQKDFGLIVEKIMCWDADGVQPDIWFIYDIAKENMRK